MIADGLPGAGHNAWIFFDEIESQVTPIFQLAGWIVNDVL